MRLLPPKDPLGHWLAADCQGSVEVRFVGRGPGADRSAVLDAVGGRGLDLSWARQVHSDRALVARPGECGEGDALVTTQADLALAIATADCVPVVLSSGLRVAAVHAGWRGVAASIVPKTLSELESDTGIAAWIGPAIGPCCYEVGTDVADQVVASSDESVCRAGAGERPHLDLQRAVTVQLRRHGVTEVRCVRECTRCHDDALASYRRDGSASGRNLTFVWRSD